MVKPSPGWSGPAFVIFTMLVVGCPSTDIGVATLREAPATPGQTPTPGAPSPAATVSETRRDQLVITPDSLVLNTPPDPFTAALSPGSTSDANLPYKYQFVGTAFLADGSLSKDVVWISSHPAIVSIDASGNVEVRQPRVTGVVTVTAAARANPAIRASASITVIDLGKVQVDVH